MRQDYGIWSNFISKDVSHHHNAAMDPLNHSFPMPSAILATAGERPAIAIRGLHTCFGDQIIHRNLDLTIARGEVFAIVGGSGTGKSTLLREIILLQRPSHGSVRVFDEEIWTLGERAAHRLRRRFGMMFQHGALFGGLTVAENVMVPLREHTRLPVPLMAELAALKISLVGLPPEAGSKYPSQLSGGMVKRAAIARALALDPDLLFLDEPTAGLDPQGAAALDELVLQLRELLGLTIIIVTHDLDTLWRVTDQVAVLGEQQVLAQASMAALSSLEHPLIRAYFTGPRARAAVID
ncbi:phospholipid/cholesterol/gamma-HCH transport system ATP-binding protein [Gammaproteobacteria bacterium]